MSLKKLLIFGAGETGAIAAEFFLIDSKEKLAGFIVDDNFYSPGLTHLGLPVHPLSSIPDRFPENKYKIFVAISYGELNRKRLRIFDHFKLLGYEFATYISSNANIWRTASIGENCLIFEGNNIQHRSQIEDNVILWSGNHIGHGSKIKHSCYLSSHVCIAGFSEVGERSFIGINSSIIDKIKVSEDCFIGAATLINRNTEPNSIYTGNPGQKNLKISAKKFFKVKEE
jgi:sugar O-acyltransferase (sialic acid O-acetyltransferase NeuD family)